MMGEDDFYYILENRKVIAVDMLTWARWFEHADNRRVAFDEGKDRHGPWELSSVFLGTDHNFGAYGPPIVFETMIFRKDSNTPDDRDCWRFATWDECEKFHRRKVADLKGIRLVKRT